MPSIETVRTWAEPITTLPPGKHLPDGAITDELLVALHTLACNQGASESKVRALRDATTRPSLIASDGLFTPIPPHLDAKTRASLTVKVEALHNLVLPLGPRSEPAAWCTDRLITPPRENTLDDPSYAVWAVAATAPGRTQFTIADAGVSILVLVAVQLTWHPVHAEHSVPIPLNNQGEPTPDLVDAVHALSRRVSITTMGRPRRAVRAA